MAADLTGFGDMRDLFQQAGRYIDGQEVDSFLVGLSAVGLGLTAATIASEGLLFSARSGVSTIKAAKRAGRLSPALVKHVGVLAADAVDTKAFGVMATALKSLDLAAARAAAKALVKPQALGRISDLGSDVATIGNKVGYRGTLQTLAVAESAEDVGRVANSPPVSARPPELCSSWRARRLRLPAWPAPPRSGSSRCCSGPGPRSWRWQNLRCGSAVGCGPSGVSRLRMA